MTNSTAHKSDISLMIIGFLFGSSGAGAAISIVGMEGFQIYGLIVFIVCIAVGVGILIYESSERKEERNIQQQNQERNIQGLTDWYVFCLAESGKTLADALNMVKSSDIEKDGTIRKKVFDALLAELSAQQENIPGCELQSEIQSGLSRIGDEWQKSSHRKTVVD